MDKVAQYRQAVKQVLDDFINYISGSPSKTESFVISDDEKNTYLVVDLGWEGHKRIRSVITLMRIVHEKVWVEIDNTDYIFVDRLLEAGIPAHDIVLAFHPPDMRQYTEFAVA